MPFRTLGFLRPVIVCGLFVFAACSKPLELAPITCAGGQEEPQGLMLSWQQDPTTTMTIDWHLNEGDKPYARVCYKKMGIAEWQSQALGTEGGFLGTDRPVFRTELTGLTPGSEYEFQLEGYARRYSFRTMPADIDDRQVVFAAGGDTFIFPELLEQMNRTVLKFDPDFVLWGGDLAYENGLDSSAGRIRWTMWFESNRKSLITDAGRVVPIVVGIGNHEVQEGYYTNHPDYRPDDESRAAIAPNFYRLFAFPGQPGYGALDFGDYLSLVVLDSGHTNPIDGVQTDWLDETLAAAQARNVAHVFPVYHVPAYPSDRDFDGANSALVRKHWVPLFEQYGVRLAFENHDHTYKRTQPIRAGGIDPEGIVYVGDGAWGVPTRDGAQRDAWYIDTFASEQHGMIVTLAGRHRTIKTINVAGAVIDEF